MIMFTSLVCILLHVVLYFCTTKNHENTKVDEKKSTDPENVLTIRQCIVPSNSKELALYHSPKPWSYNFAPECIRMTLKYLFSIVSYDKKNQKI